MVVLAKPGNDMAADPKMPSGLHVTDNSDGISNALLTSPELAIPTGDQSTQREPQYFSLADLAVGGRCKCNGHASRCIEDSSGKVTCDCRHNTAGTDCERCKPFHYERPWVRGTAKDANECIGKKTLIHFNLCLLYCTASTQAI